MADDRLSFKEMCAEFDVTPRTLRYYEYIELLQPDREGRSRFYGPRECARMKLILRGRKFGFQLEDIRQWLLIYEHEGTEAQMARLDRTCRRSIERTGRAAQTTRRSARRVAGPPRQRRRRTQRLRAQPDQCAARSTLNDRQRRAFRQVIDLLARAALDQ